MRVVVTVVDDLRDESLDVLIDAPGSTPMRSIVDMLGRRYGSSILPDGAADADTTFRQSGLVDGAVLHIGSTPAVSPELGIVALRCVGGVGAGRVERLLPGTVAIGLDRTGAPVVGTAQADTVLVLEARVGFDASVTVRSVVADDPEPLPDGPPGAVEPGMPGPAVLSPAAAAGRDVSGADVVAGSGATLDDEPIGDTWTPWPAEAVLRVGDTLLTAAPVGVDDTVLLRPPDSGLLDYNRPPRLLPPILPTAFKIPRRPIPPQPSAIPWIMVFVPAIFGIAMAAIFRQPFYLMFALMSPIMVLGQTITSRKGGKKSHRRLLAEHAERVTLIEAAVSAAVLAERDRRRDVAADAGALAVAATRPTRRLWERRPTDRDHLDVRIGVADLRSAVTVTDDRDQDRLDEAVRWTRTVPVTVPLGEFGVVGVAGPGAWPRALGKWMVGQLAVTQSPRELQFVVLTSPAAIDDWAWLNWLPHIRPASGQDALSLIGADSETIGRRLAELTRILGDRRTEADKSGMRTPRFSPDIVVVLDGARRLRAMPGVVGLLRDGPTHGIRVVCLDEEEWQLPEECAAAVLYRSDEQLVLRRQHMVDIDEVLTDRVDPEWYPLVARSLSPLRDTSGSDGQGAVPDSAQLLAVLGLEAPSGDVIVDRWRTSGASTEAVVGVGIDGAFALDLVRDGPHGLIAGTTGSGKSEFLQTLVASLAVANRPDAMTFVLIDYKGGAAFSVCSDLPHTVGLVTDLDQHLVERALRSLRAELTRREHVLALSGAKDIEDHERHLRRGGVGEQLPRLVLVIDEFAAMVKELPDFVAGLIGIAQRGRSLGVHLIMATQRPSGVVSPEIRANTNLRVALRMTDTSESSDVIDIGDAARIPKSVPGRAYARLGHASVVPFQSARVGGRWKDGDDAATVRPFVRALGWREFASSVPERPRSEDDGSAATDLSVLVGALAEANRTLGLGQQYRPWLPPLPELLVLDDAQVGSSPLDADDALATDSDGVRLSFTWAREDLPDRQEQRPAVIDLDRFAHLYVVGAPGSGRSQALRTIATSAAAATSSSDLHLYGIDCGNGALAAMAALPHCGAVVQRTQTDRATRLIERLSTEMQRRHDVIAAANAANITEQRLRAEPGDRLPHLLVLIDRWENFASTLGEVDGGSLTDRVQAMLRDGASAGIHVVIAGDRSLLTSRMSVLTDDKVMLRLTDRLDYSLGGVNHRSLPNEIPAGRGFRSDSGLELQIATLSLDTSGQGQSRAMTSLGERLHADETAALAAGGAPRIRPFRIDALPKDLDLDAAFELDGAPAPRPMWMVLGVGGDEAELRGFSFAEEGPTFIVAGPSRSGRSGMLAVMARSLLAGGTELVIAAPRPSPLRQLAGLPGVRAVFTGDDLVEDELRAVLDPDDDDVVFVVDDGELLIDATAKPWLRNYVRSAADHRRGLLLGGNTTGLAAGFGGWQVDAKKNRMGALLSPPDALAGDLIGIRIARSSISSQVVPGRALVHLGTGLSSIVQVPIVHAATRVGGVTPTGTGVLADD
ncbi:FtsK/SpoIIIE domain-containing protein [Curtobacterium sp. RRHDQ10]|uniref:FtsK/SpoIIIE domain-containing protein n=1 Tax=Curtobacterium phyllosphaerae TaxID=3413379 RepID=UPI003BEFB968